MLEKSTTASTATVRRLPTHDDDDDGTLGEESTVKQLEHASTSFTSSRTSGNTTSVLRQSSRDNMRLLTASLMLTVVLLWCVLPSAHGFAILDNPSSSLEQRSTDYDADILRRVVILSKLLSGKQLRLPSGLLTSLRSNKGDERRLVAGKRGPTSCINNCLTNGMSFVRCKSMCH